MATAARPRRDPAENVSDIRSFEDRPPFPNGFRFGANERYEIVGELGSGSTAHVLLARDRQCDRLVAVKCFRGYDDCPDESFRRASAEAETLEKLCHENIVRIHEIDRCGDTAYVVLEYEDGFALEDVLAGGALPLARAIDVTIQIASALEHSHAAGVLHLDVKPGNVWVTPDYRVKLLDFGIDSELERTPSRTRAGRTLMFGTPAYMAPEQWRLSIPDERTDVWALGVTLFELLTGDVPFAGECDHALFLCEAISTSAGPPPISRELGAPRSLDALLQRALANDRDLRFQTMSELRRALEDLARDLRAAPSARAKNSLGSAVRDWGETHRPRRA
jgi:serine/threonine-protein kinase